MCDSAQCHTHRKTSTSNFSPQGLDVTLPHPLAQRSNANDSVGALDVAIMVYLHSTECIVVQTAPK